MTSTVKWTSTSKSLGTVLSLRMTILDQMTLGLALRMREVLLAPARSTNEAVHTCFSSNIHLANVSNRNPPGVQVQAKERLAFHLLITLIPRVLSVLCLLGSIRR